VRPIELTVEALFESTQSFAAGDHESPLSEQQLRLERARYFVEAERMAASLRERWKQSPPEWNRPTGDAEVDALVWFRYAVSDDPFQRFP
jgi:hypothetical protein